MLYEFAFDPAALANWGEFQRLLGQVGFRYGRVIAQYPRHWRDLVLAAGRWKPVERLRVVEVLRKALVLNVDRGNDPEFDPSDWLSSAERHHARHPFHAIVALGNPRGHACVLPSEDVHDEARLWHVPREVIAEQTLNGLIPLLTPLLRLSREIKLVDPHFTPAEGRYRRMLKAIVEVTLKGGRQLRSFEIHLEAKSTRDCFEQDCRNQLAPHLPRTLQVDFFRWEGGAGLLHPRYLLTEHGGIRVDGGFDQKLPGNDTEVMLMEPDVWRTRLADYSAASTRFRLVDQLRIRGAHR